MASFEMPLLEALEDSNFAPLIAGRSFLTQGNGRRRDARNLKTSKMNGRPMPTYRYQTVIHNIIHAACENSCFRLLKAPNFAALIAVRSFVTQRIDPKQELQNLNTSAVLDLALEAPLSVLRKRSS
jgi:hypothetical protein